MNVSLILQMAADAMADRQALVCGDVRLTYHELYTMAAHIASEAKTAEQIAYLSEASAVFSAALFGAALAGKPFVPLNYRLAEDEIQSLLDRLPSAKLITDKDIRHEGITWVPLHDMMQHAQSAPDVDVDPSSIAIKLFTSGTTGAPKSALIRHSNITSYVLDSVEFMDAAEDESTLISVPPYHIAGIAAALSSVYAGRRMVLLPQFSPEEWLRLVSAEKVTNAFLVPTMLQRIIAHLESSTQEYDLSALRAVAYGGGKMPLVVIEQAMERLPQVDFTNAYGLTETSSTICLLTPDDHRAAFQSAAPEARKRLASVGRPLPSIEIAVRDENGQDCAANEVGDVFVRGPQVSGEYEQLGSQLNDDGWFPTRDKGFFDNEAYLFIEGRADDVIVRGGENISPGEIEDVLLQIEGIADAAVVGIPDTEWGEAIGAAIVCHNDRPAEDAIRDFVKSRLRSNRIPSVIKFLDELPYNENGKLLRRVVRVQLGS